VPCLSWATPPLLATAICHQQSQTIVQVDNILRGTDSRDAHLVKPLCYNLPLHMAHTAAPGVLTKVQAGHATEPPVPGIVTVAALGSAPLVPAVFSAPRGEAHISHRGAVERFW
jgi:hypothetical protein